jgi:putative heme transporter
MGSQEEHRSQPRWHLVLQTVAIVAITVGVAVALYLQHATIGRGLDHFGGIRWRLVVLAGLTEVVSMVALALLYSDLLRANQIRIGMPWILACCLSSNAISLTVPVIGSGIATRRTFRRFRRAGADAATASFALTVAGVVSSVTLATVIAAGAVLSGNPSAAATGAAGAMALLGGAIVVGVELRNDKGRARLLWIVRVTVGWTKRLTRHPKGESEAIASNALASLERMRLGVKTTTRIVVWGLLNWWADVACLYLCLLTVGIGNLALGKIVIVWLAGVGAASLSPTPGGIGAVEIAMVASLAAFGIRGPDAITAVLVFRMITFKLLGSFWAVIYEYVDRHRRPLAQSSGVEP